MTRVIHKLGVRGAMSRRAPGRRSHLAVRLLAGLTLAVATAGPAIAAALTFTDLGTLGGTFSLAYGINDLGQVVGSSAIAGDASTHAFLTGEGGSR